jgi:hypothetical protein
MKLKINAHLTSGNVSEIIQKMVEFGGEFSEIRVDSAGSSPPDPSDQTLRFYKIEATGKTDNGGTSTPFDDPDLDDDSPSTPFG